MKKRTNLGVYTNKKSLRMKMVKLIIKEFALSHLFDQSDDDWKVELQNKLKDTFSFKCELINFEIADSKLFGQIGVEKENGEVNVINFDVFPTGTKMEF